MELSLHGSQINLATRQKPPTPTINYPRPSSAHSASRLVAGPRAGSRPQSADDTRFLAKFRNRIRVATADGFVDPKETIKNHKRPSSSNILKLLLREPIARSWSVSEDRKAKQEPAQENQTAPKPMGSDGVTDEESSIEEEIEKVEKSPENQSPKPLKRILIPPATLDLKQKAWPEIPTAPEEKPAGRIDLPGRVSFSTADIHEEDVSEAEESETAREAKKVTKKVVHFNDEALTEKSSEEASESGKMDVESSSDQIIEDYRKEIESINRRHEVERKLAERGTSATNFFDKEYLLEKETPPEGLEATPRDLMGATSVMDKYFEVMSTPTPELPGSLQGLKITETATWDNFADFPPKLRDKSGEIISNYLRVSSSDQSDVPPAPRRPASSTRKGKNARESRKSKSALTTKPPPKVKAPDKAPLKRSKSIPILRNGENAPLDEFHIDKVESWMSIHEDSYAKKASFVEYNREWRDTPSSKTDDEGNFSLEEHGDSFSTESTYDEIQSIIKEIDADKRKSRNSFKDLKTDVEFKLATTNATSSSSDSANNGDKIQEILNYLDSVDSSCEKALQRAQTFLRETDATELDLVTEPDIVENVPKISDLLILPNHQLARRVVALSLRANELANALQLSKEHVASVRAEKAKAVRLEKQASATKLTEQKRHFEGIVARHQTFIEQLLRDKSNLCEKVGAITRRMDSQNQAWEHKLETEISRAKETMSAGEKIRKERWVKENTKKIKELTVKGLEGEIARLTQNHQEELADLRRQHQQELLAAIEETRQKHEMVEKAIRESYAEDREAVIEKERTAIRERYERQLATEQKSFEEQKARLLLDFAAEKERILAEGREKEQEAEQRRETLLRERSDIIDQVRRDQKDKQKILEEQHQAELTSVKDQFERDFIIWKREHESAMKLREAERENAIRQQCRQDRDRQIDSIVAKIDAESLKTQQEHEVKVGRLKEKYETELKELERSETSAREKYLETRHRLAESEAAIQNLQANLKQQEIELNHCRKMRDECVTEKETLKESLREELAQETKALQKERDAEIQRIYARVQQSIEKKDTTIEVLQKENVALKERTLKLEAIVRQQRKDYCTK
ncbi:centrosomal protein of 131 kDa [Phlebotomus papatasi]|uniref:centrosomal protein of 131 kDa n=1 Tax=Phlebotomus papatasi TaxID=29031 RepID=UPI0024838BF9|nr:centrosomal protein of 131 kDa [Phlebotomus papatasi]